MKREPLFKPLPIPSRRSLETRSKPRRELPDILMSTVINMDADR